MFVILLTTFHIALQNVYII